MLGGWLLTCRLLQPGSFLGPAEGRQAAWSQSGPSNPGPFGASYSITFSDSWHQQSHSFPSEQLDFNVVSNYAAQSSLRATLSRVLSTLCFHWPHWCCRRNILPIWKSGQRHLKFGRSKTGASRMVSHIPRTTTVLIVICSSAGAMVILIKKSLTSKLPRTWEVDWLKKCPSDGRQTISSIMPGHSPFINIRMYYG